MLVAENPRGTHAPGGRHPWRERFGTWPPDGLPGKAPALAAGNRAFYANPGVLDCLCKLTGIRDTHSRFATARSLAPSVSSAAEPDGLPAGLGA